MTINKAVTIYHGRYTIDLDDHEELGMNGKPTGKVFDRLNGDFQTSLSSNCRNAFFHIDLERAKDLREILDEYIAYKEGSQ